MESFVALAYADFLEKKYTARYFIGGSGTNCLFLCLEQAPIQVGLIKTEAGCFHFIKRTFHCTKKDVFH